MRRAIRPLRYLPAALLAFACLAANAHANPSVKLRATLTPNRLGQGTTIGFGFQITSHGERIPPPLTEIAVSYPSDLGIALSGIGLATCTPAVLSRLGPEGCPPNSRMGYGTALAEIPIGPKIIFETAHVTLVRAPVKEGHIGLLFYADGKTPVSTQIIFPALILPALDPFGGNISVRLPLIPSLPEAPDVAVVRLQASLGPDHLTYYERRGGHRIAYHPKGILLPNHCPRGGFPFATVLGFQDGSIARAHTAVPCPPS